MSTIAFSPAREAPRYSRGEEIANAASHGAGIFFSVFAFGLMLALSAGKADGIEIFALSLFGLSLITLFSASTFYHASSDPRRKSRLRIFDHASIYLLIAGTYSPFCLIFLRGATGWAIFAAVWAIAVLGVLLAFFFTGRFKILSTVSYVAMGWIIIFAFAPLSAVLPPQSLALLIAGGVVYTVGAVIYAIKRLPWNHPLWHLFVLGGAICHFLSVVLALPR